MEEQLNAGQVFFFRTVSTGQGGAKGQGDRSIRRGREKVESRVLEKAKKWGPRSPHRPNNLPRYNQEKELTEGPH